MWKPSSWGSFKGLQVFVQPQPWKLLQWNISLVSKQIIVASTSIKVLYFGNRWTNTSASRRFLQLIYFKCRTKWRNRSWSPLISPLMVFVPSNLLNCIWCMSTHLSCRTSQINLNNASVPLLPITSTKPKNSYFFCWKSASLLHVLRLPLCAFWIFHVHRVCGKDVHLA